MLSHNRYQLILLSQVTVSHCIEDTLLHYVSVILGQYGQDSRSLILLLSERFQKNAPIHKPRLERVAKVYNFIWSSQRGLWS